MGHLTLPEALTLLLRGTGCGFRVLDNGGILVLAERDQAPSRPVQPAAAVAFHVAPSPSVVVEELLVTSSQRPTVLDRAPYSVTVLSAGDISDSAAVDLGELSPLVGDATFTDLGPGRDKIFVRGLADSVVAGRTQSTVGLYLDGARISYNAPDPDLRLTDIDRIEVLRGPQGALYGAGSIGGVFEIATRRPALNAFSAALNVSASATIGGAPSGSIDAVVNAPLVTDTLGVRVVAYDEVQGGYLNNPILGLNNVNRFERRGFRVGVRWRIDPDWSVTASLTRQSLSVADGQYADPQVGPLSRDTRLQEPYGDDFRALQLSLSGRRPWGDLTETTSVVRQSQANRFDATLALPFYGAAPSGGPSPFDQSDTSEIIVNEISLTSAPKGRLRWLGGLFQSLTDNESNATLAAGLSGASAATSLYGEQRHDTINELAAYGQLTYLLTPNLDLSAGGRLFGSWLNTRSTVVQPAANESAAFAGSLTASGFAPQVVLRYRPADDVTLYLQASEGYRAGGFNTAGLFDQVFSPYGVGQQPWRRYGGDELWNYEAGAKFSLLRGRMRLRASAFYMLWRNIQSDQLSAAGLPYTANLGDGRDIGWEGDVDFRPDDHWRVRLNASFAKPEVTGPNPTFVTSPGFGLSGAWNYWASFQASYSHNIGRDLRLRTVATFSYVGGANLTLDAATAGGDSSNVATGVLKIELSRSDWSMAAFAKAPIIGGADTFGFGNPFTFRIIDQITPARPATFGLDLKVKLP